MTWQPNKQTKEILDRALELVNSVPYRVSARWVFYRLLQEGYYGKKDDYKNKFMNHIRKARHEFYDGWRPDTLEDQTREAIIRGDGYASVERWLKRISTGLACNLDKWKDQDCYIELWYEARAMTEQFLHYTKHITLRPMGGQASIPYKWQIAKDLEKAAEQYQMPIVILYFGDLDPAGETIFEVVETDVRKWCTADFEVVHCGLTEDQVIKYNVPENDEKPGEYQWEALTDSAANEIITGAVNRFLRRDVLSEIMRKERGAEIWLDKHLQQLPIFWRKEHVE
jgi:hypothetical protein